MLVLVVGSNRTEILRSLLAAFSLLVSPKILIPLLLYIAWVLTVLFPASRLGLWEPGLWKTTILWLFLSGFGLIFNLNDAIGKPRLFRRVLVRVVSVSAIVEFVATLQSFPLWVEIPAQGLAFFFVVAAVAARDRKHAALATPSHAYLVSFGLAALLWAVWHLGIHWSDIDRGALAREFFLPIWLTPVALIFVYGFAVVAAYESVFRRMRMTREEGRLTKQLLAMAFRVRGSLETLRRLNSVGAPQQLASTNAFREAWNEVGKIKLDIRERIETEEASERRLVENAGRAGVDERGQQLDQREHDTTRQALRWLATCHMGHYRNEEQYRRDLLPLLESGFEQYGLPQTHGIAMHISSDGQRWYAERQTVTGHWFAIGAAGPPPDQWLFDGPEKPKGFPSESTWDQWGGGEQSTNWNEGVR